MDFNNYSKRFGNQHKIHLAISILRIHRNLFNVERSDNVKRKEINLKQIFCDDSIHIIANPVLNLAKIMVPPN